MTKPDVTMMILVHNAFRRDMRRMRDAASAAADDPAAGTALRAGWATFSRYLTIHHTAEDDVLWPMLETKSAGGTPLLVEMAAEHGQLDPLLAAIDAKLASAATSGLAADFDRLTDILLHHLDHEEASALPLIRERLTPGEWRVFGDDQRRRIGIRGGSWFFPWLLDDAPLADQAKALSLLPPPLRLVYRFLWQPRYQRRSPWRSRPVGVS